MLRRDWRARPRPRRQARRRAVCWAEALEPRYLLVAPPINVAAGLMIASGLPLPGLATGQGLATTSQTLPTTAVTVAPASAAAPLVEAPTATATATGPATTLSPLMDDSETAAATASEVARPTPGRSDRISIILPAPETVPIVNLRVPSPIEVIPGPEVVPPPPALNNPVEQPSVPVAPVAAIPPVPTPVAPPAVTAESVPVLIWDAALHCVATDDTDEAPGSLAARTEEVLAAGALLAAWGGWKYGPRSTGRSRRRPRAISLAEATSGVGTGL